MDMFIWFKIEGQMIWCNTSSDLKQEETLIEKQINTHKAHSNFIENKAFETNNIPQICI